MNPAMASSNGSSPNYPSTTATSPSNGGSISEADCAILDSDILSGHGSHTDDSSVTSSGLLSTTVCTKCPLCNATLAIPKVLSCLHSFCQGCLDKKFRANQTFPCPECQDPTVMPVSGAAGLPTDYAVNTVLDNSVADKTLMHCTGCKSKDTCAVAHCFDCANFLCPNCVMAHQFMHCFEGHTVKSFEEIDVGGLSNGSSKTVYCSRHNMEQLKYYCDDCDLCICKECLTQEHKMHARQPILESSRSESEYMRQMVGCIRVQASKIRSIKKGVEHSMNRMEVQYEKAQAEVTDTFNFYTQAIEDRMQELLKELETTFESRKATLEGQISRLQSFEDRLYTGCEFVDKITKYTSPTELLEFKKVFRTRIMELLTYQPESATSTLNNLDFVSNFQAIQVGVKNTFGYIRQGTSDNPPPVKPQPIARPNGIRGCIGASRIANPLPQIETSIGRQFGGSNNSLNSLNDFHFPSHNALQVSTGPYDTWSTGADTTITSSTAHDVFSSLPVLTNANDNMVELTTRLINANIYPPKSQIKRQKMIYHCKFGEFGVMEGQFTEPSGVTVNAQNDIIVADTNNHRIQIFDKEGRFKFQFGECGKRDGQLLYPNRVSVVRQTGDIIVTERSPTHQVQIFNQYGQFVRKFGANVLQHPRGVCVDNMGRIIIVECKVMRVIIFDLFGNILQKFGCSKHLEFPNGVVVNDREEIFISDNRAHCVKVFNYQGQYLRQIGGEGVSNYPIGVGINSSGDVLIADNHNNFNLTIFSQDGQVLSALESKVKHAQCFDVALLDENSIVLASKDYRLYVYRYAQAVHGAMYNFLAHPEATPLLLDTYN